MSESTQTPTIGDWMERYGRSTEWYPLTRLGQVTAQRAETYTIQVEEQEDEIGILHPGYEVHVIRETGKECNPSETYWRPCPDPDAVRRANNVRRVELREPEGGGKPPHRVHADPPTMKQPDDFDPAVAELIRMALQTVGAFHEDERLAGCVPTLTGLGIAKLETALSSILHADQAHIRQAAGYLCAWDIEEDDGPPDWYYDELDANV